MIVESNENIKYVTYFQKGETFDPDKIVIDLNNKHNGFLFKPDKGFWGSPVDAKYGWKEWTESEYFRDYDYDNPIYWTLISGKILQIDWDEVKNKTSSDLIKYITKPYHIDYTLNDLYIVLDWDKMLKDDIVAVQLMDGCIGHCFKYDLEMHFNAWDCESIVVLDKSRLKFV